MVIFEFLVICWDVVVDIIYGSMSIWLLVKDGDFIEVGGVVFCIEILFKEFGEIWGIWEGLEVICCVLIVWEVDLVKILVNVLFFVVEGDLLVVGIEIVFGIVIFKFGMVFKVE